ncbi:SDR family NAD(P)-dependent oxidoreductase [Alphaproteobacteria bacterium]|nr:SDR family NAD(P)-dependent oxidoreductase [Alphaproteobacteria bacterium]
MGLAGKTIIITGASKGIGARACRVFAEAGASVVGVARSVEELENLQNAFHADGLDFAFASIDLVGPDAPRHLAELMERQVPDVFINNAGATRPAAFQDVTVEDFDAIMRLNLKAGFFASQAAVRAMIAAPKRDQTRSVIHMSSMLGRVALPGRAVYAATKHALEGLTKAMALDLASERIRVNSICPTYIETPLTRPLMENQAFRAFVAEKMPLSTPEQPIGHVGDLDGALLYLSDSSLSDLVTGTNLVVDGGWGAQ